MLSECRILEFSDFREIFRHVGAASSHDKGKNKGKRIFEAR